MSDSLKPAWIQKAENELGLKVLSAFNDEAWDRLYDGWELDEHLSRQMHKRVRQAAVEDLQRCYEPADTPDKMASMRAELAELHGSWPDKYNRERSWSVWRREQ